MVRAQRIFAGIELFALALWAGGLFFLLFIALPGVDYVLGADPLTSGKLLSAWFARFGSLEIILGLAILASNFVKLVAFPKTGELQRAAVFFATMMLLIALACHFSVRPQLEDMHSDLLNINSVPGKSNPTDGYSLLEKKHLALLRTNLIFCLFMIYCFRVFEERKIRAIVNIMKHQS
jgi:hypothetical protein